jgi:raffinose/stachyose/melibiose transport system substrate-binding protein
LAALSLVAHDSAAGTGDTRTITMMAIAPFQPGWDALVANFERVYPAIDVDITYAPGSSVEYQLETTQLAAGNAPDLLATTPGCGTPIAICRLAAAGDLAPMVHKAWAKRSLPLVTSLAKHGRSLYAFTASVAPFGLFANDALFRKLGLKVPQTFAQLLAVCARAKADGTAAVLLAGGAPVSVTYLLTALSIGTVYGKDPHWAARLRAGNATFEGTPGWHRALGEFVELNDAGCFPRGVAAASVSEAAATFAQGQGLMLLDPSSFKGQVDAAAPRFAYSFHPLPAATAHATSTLLDPGNALSVNAHASADAQAAAQMFVDFVARPKQNALYAKITGGLTQYEFLKGALPAFMSPYANVFKRHEYVVNPQSSWWNADVYDTLQQDGIGLITGQLTVGAILDAMDAAWKRGPG